MEQYLSALGIEHRKTALYHPQANGGVDRFNRELGNALRLARAEENSIEDAVFTCLANYCLIRDSTTGKSPAELMTGSLMLMPLGLFARAAKPRPCVTFDPKIRDHVKKHQRRRKRNYDKRHTVRDTQLRAGQQVNIRRDVVPDKLMPRGGLRRRWLRARDARPFA